MCSAVVVTTKNLRNSEIPRHIATDEAVYPVGEQCIHSRSRYRSLVADVLDRVSSKGPQFAPLELASVAVCKNLSGVSSVAIFDPEQFCRVASIAIASHDRTLIQQVLIASGNKIREIISGGLLAPLLWGIQSKDNDPEDRLTCELVAHNFLVNVSQSLLYGEACERIPELMRILSVSGLFPKGQQVVWESILSQGEFGVPTTILERSRKDLLGPSTKRKLPSLLWYMGISKEELPRSGVVLDIGSGFEARAAMQYAHLFSDVSVRAVDPIFKTKRPSERVPSNMNLIGGRAEKLPAEDGEVALTSAMYSVPFWSRNYHAVIDFLQEVRRVTAVRGQALIAPFRSNDSSEPHIGDFGLTARFELDLNSLFPSPNWTVQTYSGTDGFEWSDPKRFRVLRLMRNV